MQGLWGDEKLPLICPTNDGGGGGGGWADGEVVCCISTLIFCSLNDGKVGGGGGGGNCGDCSSWVDTLLLGEEGDNLGDVGVGGDTSFCNDKDSKTCKEESLTWIEGWGGGSRGGVGGTWSKLNCKTWVLDWRYSSTATNDDSELSASVLSKWSEDLDDSV